MASSPRAAAASTHSKRVRSVRNPRRRIHVVTDSASAFPNPAIALRQDVTVLPLTIHVGTRSFLDQNGDQVLSSAEADITLTEDLDDDCYEATPVNGKILLPEVTNMISDLDFDLLGMVVLRTVEALRTEGA